MADPAYAEWLQRGRTHQWEGRPVDAMLCFQRAAALAPDGVDARYLLGEVRWQLGTPRDALAAWRDAARVGPAHLASHLALAEALLALGEPGPAREAAERAVALAPDDASARQLRAVAALASDHDRDALDGLAAHVAESPGRLASPAVAGALAGALRARPDARGANAMLAALVPHLGNVGYALLVPTARAAFAAGAPPALEGARAAIADAALGRPIAPADVDALREVALAFARGGDTRTAAKLVLRHAQATAALASPPAPPRWPARTAGEALRVVALIPSDPQAAEQAVGLLAAAKASPAIAWTLLSYATPAAGVRQALPDAAVRVLAPGSETAAAEALAAEDPDLVVDLAGIGAPGGALLACRPAPVAIGIPVDAPAHAPPLVDDCVEPSVAGVESALARAKEAARARPRCAVAAAALAAAFARAVEAHRDGRHDEAQALYDTVLVRQPQHARTLHLAAGLARERGETDAARALLARALAVAPGFVDARVSAARLDRDGGHIDEGIALADAGLALAPRSQALWRVRGELLLARHDGAAARDAFAQALALAPTDAEAHFNFGVALQKLHAGGEAARAYQRALAFDPDFADAHFNLGVLFQEGGHLEPALAAYRAVLARDPRHASAYRNLGEALFAAGRFDEWLANFRRFEAACPDALPLAVQALEACQYAADHAGLERYLEGLRKERFRARDAAELADGLEQLLYLLLFFDVEPEMLLRFANTYDTTAPQVYGEVLPPPQERRTGKLRIGYLSADLRNHVMGKMMWQALRHHDRERFAVHCYSLSPVRDEWTERFAGASDRFLSIAGQDEREAAERIAEDDLDLLVDLSGHTRGGKPGILARKPARVQITHVASAGSVGLSTVDFKLTDRFADPPGNQAFLLETLLPMAGCVYPYRHVEPAAGHPFSRPALGLAPDAIVIGAFVTPMKLSRRCLVLWRDVLARLPRARLAFSPTHPGLRPVFERLCVAAGIARERLAFLPQGRDDAENQARYAVVDFVLDPMPFGGVNGVLEPLDAGVPVVALVGARHGERSAYSILANLGVTATLAETGRDYVEIAVRLAEDAGFMARVRDAIRAGLARSPLTDVVAHTRALEAAYLEALSRKAPEALDGAGRA